jgi:hypothetical protein
VLERIREIEEETNERVNRPGELMTASEQELLPFLPTGRWNISFE